MKNLLELILALKNKRNLGFRTMDNLQECLQKYVSEEVPHINMTKEQIIEAALRPKPLLFKDESRSDLANKEGGK